MDKPVLLIDGSHLAHRSFHVFSKFSNSKGYLTGGVYGFFSILQSYVEKYTNRVIISWEGNNLWRKDYLSSYKEGRNKNKTPAEVKNIYSSIKDIKEVCALTGLLQVSKPKYEADDIIAFFTRQFKSNIKIISGDKDLLQLIDDEKNVSVIRPTKEGLIEYKEKDVEVEFGVPKEHLITYLAICGDRSDNIPGISGYGKVKTRKLIENNEDPIDYILELNPGYVDRLSLYYAMVNLNDEDSMIRELDNDDISHSPADIFSLNSKLFEFEIESFNAKSLIESCYNPEFVKEVKTKFL